MEQLIYDRISDKLRTDSEITKLTSHGLCRVWARAAIILIRHTYPEIEVEAREVDIEPYLQHTFIRLIVGKDRPFICDLIGVAKFEPFTGYEDEAPEHLKNSRSDIINSYI